MKMSIKVKKYIDRLFEDVSRPLFPPGVLIAAAIQLTGITLAVYGLVLGGPAVLMTSLQAITWAFIALNILALSVCGAAYLLSRAILPKTDTKKSDQHLFGQMRLGNFISKAVTRSDTLTFLVIAIAAGWQVATVFLILLGVFEIIGLQVGNAERKTRISELEKMEQYELDAIFDSPEEKSLSELEKLFEENR